MTIDYSFTPIHRLAADLAGGRLSARDLVDSLLARIATCEPKLHAFTEVYADDARLAAEAADKAIRAGHAVGPLHGIPIALKDLVEIAGRRTMAGTEAWRERRSTLTATLTRRLIAQGLIVIGKTHTVEFAMGGWGTNQRLGTPWNPWDPKVPRTPGGSSSGSGVAVAAGLVPWAVGTDTGGSVRLPAAFCGITGLKTTIGSVSVHGVLPLSPTLDTPGPMARSVEDAALLYQAMQGRDPLDPRTLACPPAVDPMPGLKRGVRGFRLARMSAGERGRVAPEVLAAYDESVKVLARLGAEIVDLSLPTAFADVAELNGRIMAAEGYAALGALVDDESLPLDSDVRPRLAAGRDIKASAYLAALRRRDEMKREFAAALAEVDALLTPTTESAALRLDEVDQGKAPSHFTRFANFLDLCALAVPNGFTQSGLPTSLQIVCRGYEEATALRIGWAYQNATDWHERRPPELPS